MRPRDSRIKFSHGWRSALPPAMKFLPVGGEKRPSSPAARCARSSSRFLPASPRNPFTCSLREAARALCPSIGPLWMPWIFSRRERMSCRLCTRPANATIMPYAPREFLAEVAPFLSNMAERFAWADIIVCRAGAITAAEVAAAGRAAIFIPFGHATDSHQLRNAQEMAGAGAGRLIPEQELTADRLAREIFSLLDQPREIENLATSARRRAHPDAAREIVDLIEQAARPAPRGSGQASQKGPLRA